MPTAETADDDVWERLQNGTENSCAVEWNGDQNGMETSQQSNILKIVLNLRQDSPSFEDSWTPRVGLQYHSPQGNLSRHFRESKDSLCRDNP